VFCGLPQFGLIHPPQKADQQEHGQHEKQSDENFVFGLGEGSPSRAPMAVAAPVLVTMRVRRFNWVVHVGAAHCSGMKITQTAEGCAKIFSRLVGCCRKTIVFRSGHGPLSNSGGPRKVVVNQVEIALVSRPEVVRMVSVRDAT
jgi:hypothetical protein